MKRVAGMGGVLALILWPHVATAQSAANRLPSGPGHDEVTQACSACHGLDIVTGRRLSRADWQTTVDNMIARGAKLTDPQAAQVVAYLTQNFGLTPTAAATAGPPVAGPRAGGRGQNRTTYGNRPDGMGPGASPFLPPKQMPRSPADTARPVTDAMLVNPPPESWLTWRRTYDDHGFSPLTQINKTNVANLALAWSWTLPPGPQEGTPLEHDGVLLVPGYGDVVLAFDAASGDLLWQYTPPAGTRGGYKKNLAVYGDKVYAALQTGHMIALNIKTGEVVWDGVVRDGVGMTDGPLAVRGKIIVGTTGLTATGGQIVALDAQTGKVAWRFKTIAQPDEPGGESWNGETAEQRTGASVWTAGSYDVESNLVYFGAGQTYNTGPLRKKIDQPGVTTDALYTDTTLALDPDTGKLAWFYQHMKDDQWDMDWAFERMVFTMKIDGKDRRVVATAGKPGLYDVLDARTGQYLFSKDMGIQNLITAVDPRTGEKTYNPALNPATQDKWTLCPYFNSGKEWLPGSYSDLTRLVYVPLNEACADMFKLPPGGQGLLTGLGFTMQPPAHHDGNYSHLAAWNPQTRKIEWILRQRAPLTTGTLATQGGLVFTGFTDRSFKAFDDATGEELWSTRLSDTPSAAPISYSVNGRQYVAVITGCCSYQTRDVQAYVPEVKLPPDHGAVLWVFQLPVARRKGANGR